MSWLASITDVADVTGRTVDAASLAEASSVIEIYCNRTQAASGAISKRDTHWLKVATSWQACRVATIATDDGRTVVTKLLQDGVQAEFASQVAQDLHPLAIRALKNLSWKGSRAQRTPNVNERHGQQRPWEVDYLNENTDESVAWDAL